MNEELTALVIKAGAPNEVMEQMWFHLFCQKFAYLLLAEAEGSIE